MALLTIAEPGQSAQPHQRRLAVGIDLGTTNSLVATIRNAQLEILPDAQGRNLCPSAVYYGKVDANSEVDSSADKENNTKPLVGYQALAQASRDPKNTIISVKRFIGKKLSEVQGEGAAYDLTATENGLPLFNTAAGAKNAISVSAEILSQLKAQAEQRLGGELYGAVITVPAYFDDTQRQATKDAAELAGLKVLRLLNEPTAAAIAYGINENQEGTVVVYDLGGGTFDVSVLRIEKGVFQVLATGGDTVLGGDDYDQALLEHLLAQANLKEHYGSLPDQVRRLLLEVAIEAKKALSHGEQVELATLPALQSLQGYASLSSFSAKVDQAADKAALQLATGIALLANATLTRAEFETLTKKLTDKTLLICHRVLKDAKVTKDQVDQVILVGGSTRMPVIAQQVEKFFGRDPLCSQNPDEVVALGAAMQADLLAGNKDADYLLLDVLPLSLGVEVYGGLVEKIIPRNTTIPTARAQEFTTAQDGQTGLKLHVVQGERDMAADCRSLANFSLKGLPPRAAGALKIRVTYQVDADGLLSVSAKELTSGVSTQVQVKLSYGLTEDEVLKMLQESSEFAQLDVALRKLSETQVESQLLCESVEAQLNNYHEILGQLLTRDEHEQILRNLEHVHKLREKFSLTRLKEQGMPEAASADGAVKHVPLNNSHAQQLKEWANELYFWTQQLEVSTREFAAKIMTQSVKEALTGKHVDKVDI